MDKNTHIERLKVFTNISYCFIVYAFVWNHSKYYSQVLVHSTVVNSRFSHRYIPTNALSCYFVSSCISQIQTGIEIPVRMISTWTTIDSVRKFQIFLDASTRMAKSTGWIPPINDSSFDSQLFALCFQFSPKFIKFLGSNCFGKMVILPHT